jgi:hypothetical protein
MSRACRFTSVPAAIVLVAACADAPATPLEPPHERTAESLELVLPAFHPDMLVQGGPEELSSDTRDGGAPLRTIDEGEEAPSTGEMTEVPLDAVSAIYDARTFVYFNPDHVYAQGEHNYQGNRSRIETTLDVWYDGQQIASQLGVKEESKLFLFSVFTLHYIQAVSRVYSGYSCGLAASASSLHSAWWEAVVGSPVSKFHESGTSSFATRREQPACEPDPPPSTEFSLYNDYGGGYCWVSIWYDIWTGEIIHLDILYCE